MTGSKKQYFLRELHALPRNNRQSYPQKNAQKSKAPRLKVGALFVY